MPEATEEKKQHTAPEEKKPAKPSGEPFGLLEEDRPMLPGESKVPEQQEVSAHHKTTGEKAYDRIQFAIGNVFILFFTAVIAYVAKYGKDKYGPVPNVFRKFQDWLYDKLLHNKVFPLEEKGEFAKRMAGATAGTMVLFHGGNLFAPAMRWLENNREKIATAINKRWGKPGEVEAGHERLKDAPKQSWGDVIKGRIAAWLIVFASFATADTILGKDKKTGMYKFDKYEEWFGRKVAGLVPSGKELSKVPMEQPLNPAQSSNSAYRFSKILALDLYATSAALIIWNFVSRLSASLRSKSPETPSDMVSGKTPREEQTVASEMKENDTNEKKTSFASQERNQKKDFITRATAVPSADASPAV